jgi:hypothetical protein
MNRYTLFFYKNKLSFLTKPVIDYEIGEIISIPFDSSGFSNIQINTTTDGKLEFIVIEKEADRIKLIAKNIITTLAYDAAEPENTIGLISTSGNSRWDLSNIRQWLNSDGAANSWFTSSHEFDIAPTYINEPGFLTGFSSGTKQHFVTSTVSTYLPTTYEIGSVDTNDIFYLPEYGEIPSNYLSIDADSSYFTREKAAGLQVSNLYYIDKNGNRSNSMGKAAKEVLGIRPIILIK